MININSTAFTITFTLFLLANEFISNYKTNQFSL